VGRISGEKGGERRRTIRQELKREEVVKRIIHLAIALCAVVVAGRAVAQTYPDRPVKLVVPFAAAGPTDVIGRLMADSFSKSLGGNFYVENRAGAGGNIGTAAVGQSPPDGHTLLVISTGFVVNPSLQAKVPYDAVKDFAPISLIAVTPNVLTVHPGVPAKTVKELIDLIKANPGKYSYGSPGIGSTPHLSGEMFRLSQGIDLPVVQFNGAGPLVQTVVGGHLPVCFTAMTSVAPQIKAGQLRPLVVLGDKRVSWLPDVPTAAEAGLAGQEAYTITGLVAPAKTPKAIIDLLHREVVKMVAGPAAQKRLDDFSFEVVASTPQEFEARIKVELAKWGKVIRDAKIRVDGK
jgi:tripartite-type tricarboxylate transporter receptor subunit TctC